jgi:hypothetical protein
VRQVLVGQTAKMSVMVRASIRCGAPNLTWVHEHLTDKARLFNLLHREGVGQRLGVPPLWISTQDLVEGLRLVTCPHTGVQGLL